MFQNMRLKGPITFIPFYYAPLRFNIIFLEVRRTFVVVAKVKGSRPTFLLCLFKVQHHSFFFLLNWYFFVPRSLHCVRGHGGCKHNRMASSNILTTSLWSLSLKVATLCSCLWTWSPPNIEGLAWLHWHSGFLRQHNVANDLRISLTWMIVTLTSTKNRGCLDLVNFWLNKKRIQWRFSLNGDDENLIECMICDTSNEVGKQTPHVNVVCLSLQTISNWWRWRIGRLVIDEWYNAIE